MADALWRTPADLQKQALLQAPFYPPLAGASLPWFTSVFRGNPSHGKRVDGYKEARSYYRKVRATLESQQSYDNRPDTLVYQPTLQAKIQFNSAEATSIHFKNKASQEFLYNLGILRIPRLYLDLFAI